MSDVLAPSAAVGLLCSLADDLARTVGTSTVTVRATRAALDEVWQGPASAATLAEVDRLLGERSAIAHALLAFVEGGRALIPMLEAAEQARVLVDVMDAVNLVSTVAAVASLGLDPVADAIRVASAAGLDAAVQAGRAELAQWVQTQLTREVFAASLAGIGRRTVVTTAATVTWDLAGQGALDVWQGRVGPVAAPGWGSLPGAVGWSLLGGRREPGPPVATHVGGLDLSDHLEVRHTARSGAWLIDRLLGRVPDLERRPPRMATSFVSAHDVDAALDVVRGHLPELVRAISSRPGARVPVLLPLPAGIAVRGWRNVHGRLVPVPRADLTQIRVVVSSRPGDNAIVTVMVDHLRPWTGG